MGATHADPVMQPHLSITRSVFKDCLTLCDEVAGKRLNYSLRWIELYHERITKCVTLSKIFQI